MVSVSPSEINILVRCLASGQRRGDGYQENTLRAKPETFVHEVCLRSRIVLEDPVPDGNVSPLGLRLIESVVLVFALPLAVLGRVRGLPASVALHDFLSAVDRAAYSKYVIPV